MIPYASMLLIVFALYVPVGAEPTWIPARFTKSEGPKCADIRDMDVAYYMAGIVPSDDRTFCCTSPWSDFVLLQYMPEEVQENEVQTKELSCKVKGKGIACEYRSTRAVFLDSPKDYFRVVPLTEKKVALGIASLFYERALENQTPHDLDRHYSKRISRIEIRDGRYELSVRRCGPPMKLFGEVRSISDDGSTYSYAATVDKVMEIAW